MIRGIGHVAAARPLAHLAAGGLEVVERPADTGGPPTGIARTNEGQE